MYYDYQAMVEHDISRETTLRLFAFGADDRFKLTLNNPDSKDPAIGGDANQTSSFGRLQARVETRPSSTTRISSQVSAGREGQHVTVGTLGFDLKLDSIDARSDVRVQLSPGITAVAGIDIEYLSYDVTWKAPPSNFDSTQSTGPLFGRPSVELKGKGDVFRPAAYTMLELTPGRGPQALSRRPRRLQLGHQGLDVDPRIGVRYDVTPGFRARRSKAESGSIINRRSPTKASSPLAAKASAARAQFTTAPASSRKSATRSNYPWKDSTRI